MHAALALFASAVWGCSDFLGGTLARRVPPLTVVGVSQGAALLVLVPVAAVFGGGGLGYLPWALAAGVVGLAALRAFYEGLAVGTMGVVAPIASLGVVVPVAVGVAQGGTPAPAQLAGIAVAVAGVVLASGPELRGGVGTRPVALAAISALGFGLVIYFIAVGSRTSLVMTLVSMRAATVVPVAVVAALRGRLPAVRTGVRGVVLPLIVVGLADLSANAAYGVAVTGGLLAVVAVLSSLYPVATVLLARVVHAERLRPVQVAGVVAALSGVVLIAAGGGAG